jgi:hypothetical protein
MYVQRCRRVVLNFCKSPTVVTIIITAAEAGEFIAYRGINAAFIGRVSSA